MKDQLPINTGIDVSIVDDVKVSCMTLGGKLRVVANFLIVTGDPIKGELNFQLVKQIQMDTDLTFAAARELLLGPMGLMEGLSSAKKTDGKK